MTATWAAGWYVTKRHLVSPDWPGEGTADARCSRFTELFPLAGFNVIPPADSPEVMALPACKHSVVLTEDTDAEAAS